MERPKPSTLIHSIVTIAMTVGLSYFGYEKYEASKDTGTSITIEAPKADHSHVAVVSQNDINQIVRNAIATAVKQQDRKNLELFKKKESWD